MSDLRIDPAARLFIALPSYQGMLSIQTAMSLMASRDELHKARIRTRVKPYAGPGYIPLVRNVLTAQFMASGMTHVLFIDADLKFEPEAPLRLLAASQVHEVCCGVYPKKTYPVSLPVNFVMDGNGKPHEHPETGYYELRDACTGFMLIRRETIMRLMALYPERKCSFRPDTPEDEQRWEYNLFDCFIDSDGRYLSEDFGFSRLAQKAGISLWADPEIGFSHFGTHEYKGGIADVMEPVTV